MTGPGAARLALMTEVASRFYLHDRSKIEIAQEFEISRFQVARLLDSARAHGLVHIDIRYPDPLNAELAEHVRDAFGLRKVLVTECSDPDRARVRQDVARTAAEFLRRTLTRTDVLGFACARSVDLVAKTLTSLPPIPIVQLTGADNNALTVVREAAHRSTGPTFCYDAPLVAPTVAVARAVRLRPEVARAVKAARHITKAVVDIGLWQDGCSDLHDALGRRDRDEMRKRGTVAELAGVLIAADGAPVVGGITDRVVGLV